MYTAVTVIRVHLYGYTYIYIILQYNILNVNVRYTGVDANVANEDLVIFFYFFHIFPFGRES